MPTDATRAWIWAGLLALELGAPACSSTSTTTDTTDAAPDSAVAGEADTTDAGSSDTGPAPGDAGSPRNDGATPMDASGVPEGAATTDGGAPVDAADAAEDADGDAGCFVTSVGVYGQCTTTAACAGLGSHMSTPGYCPGPAGIECCTVTPNVADNPPVPAGWQLMPQSAVTPAMTAWAVAILQAPTTYPMFSTAMQTFGALNVLARVEWHPPDFQNSTVHRGVTLYEPQ